MNPISWSPDQDRIHSLDGLRAASISLVVAAHFIKIDAIPAGFGVSIFFVISGFLITRLLLGEHDRTGDIDLLAFYRRRVFRLFPAIVVSILVAWLVQNIVGKDWVTWDRALASLLFLQNYYQGFFPFHGPLSIHWSLAVEEHFYLVFPIALIIFHKRLGGDFITILVLICVAVFTMRAIAVPLFDDQEAARQAIYKYTHFRIDTILAGCILALMAHHASTRGHLKFVVACHPVLLGLAILVAGFLLRGEIAIVLKSTFQAVGITLIVAGVLFSERCTLPRWALNLPPVVWLGRISFSLYLLHTPADHLAAHFLPWGPHDWPTMPFAVALALLMSWASYRWVETPIIAFGRRLKATKNNHYSLPGVERSA